LRLGLSPLARGTRSFSSIGCCCQAVYPR